MASRTGSARVFFEVVGSFQADKLLKDAESSLTVLRAIMLDAFGGVAEAIQFTFEGISEVIQEQIDAYYAYEEQMIQVRKFYQGDPDDVERFADSARVLGETFAFSGAEALKAAANMAQMKTVLQSQEAVIAGTQLGLLFAEIGNMESQEGMKKLTSLMQQTGFAMGGLTREQYRNLEGWEQAEVVYSNTMRVLDQLNTVENSSVATMQEMTFVLSQFASQANLAGESMATMSSMAALLVEAGEETSRAGTGLKMMFSRLAVDGGDASVAIAEVVPHLDAQMISTMSLTEVITELVPYYDKLTSIEKIRLTQAMAGNRHYVKLQKLLENHERLLELNTMAYTGQYGAADEFMNRQKSMVFQIDRANATIENQRVEVGENLVEAYKRALAPQYYFLKGLEHITDESYELDLRLGKIRFEPIISNIMFMAESMKQLEVPLNFLMGLLNVYISYKTLHTILRQTKEMQDMQQDQWKQELAIKQQVIAVNQSLGKSKLRSIREVQAAEYVAFQADVAHMQLRAAGRQKLINQDNVRLKAVWKEHHSLGVLDTAAKVQESMRLLAIEDEIRISLARHETEKAMFHEKMAMAKLTYEQNQEVRRNQVMYWETTLNLRLSQQQAQTAYIANIKREVTALSNEIVIMRELTDEEKEHLAVRLEGLWLSIREEQLHLSEMLRKEQLADLTADQRMKLEELIETQREAIRTLGGFVAGIEGLIYANQQLGTRTLALEKETLSWTNSIRRVNGEISLLFTTMQFGSDYYQHFTNQMAAGNIKLSNSMRRVTSAAGGLMGFMALIESDGDKMMGSIIGMSIATGMLNTALLISKKRIDGVTASVIALEVATGVGLVLAVAGLAYVIGNWVWDKLKPDESFEEALDAIEDLNEGVSEFHRNMTELSTMGGVIDEALLGGRTWNDLRSSSELASQTITDITDKITELEGMRDVVGLEEATRISLQNRILVYDELLSKVTAIDTAHRQLSDTMEFTFREWESPTTGWDFFGEGWSESQEKAYQNRLSNQFLVGIESTEAIRNAAKGWYVLSDGVKYYYDTQEEQQEHLRDIEMKFQYDRMNHIRAYAEEMNMTYASVLEMVEGEANAISDSMATALDELNEFADAREELFFGTQAQFQGAIYKQITQGGVESVLHRVEIMQTNVFNGVTIDEAIDKVTQGVVSNLRAQGVAV